MKMDESSLHNDAPLPTCQREAKAAEPSIYVPAIQGHLGNRNHVSGIPRERSEIVPPMTFEIISIRKRIWEDPFQISFAIRHCIEFSWPFGLLAMTVEPDHSTYAMTKIFY
jgi:hypothetical protein